MRLVRCGKFDDLGKIAFPVRFTPEEETAMRGEGGYLVTDPAIAEPDVMPHVSTKGKIRAVAPALNLPRILFPTKKNIVELEGHQYYLVDIQEPKKKADPQGSIYLMDIETGAPVRKDLLPNANALNAIKEGALRTSIEKINANIRKWNERVTALQDVKNPSTWPLQIKAAEEAIDERLNAIEGMIGSTQGKLESIPAESPAWGRIQERLTRDLKAGTITDEQDQIDTAMFLYDNDQDAFLATKDDAGNVISLTMNGVELPISDTAKKAIGGLMGVRSEGDVESTRKRVEREEARRQRMDAELPEPILEPLQELTLEKAKGGYPSADVYFGRGSYAGQPRAILASLQETKNMLTPIKSTFEGLREYLGALEQGARSNEVLTSSGRGAEIRSSIKDFQDKGKKFLAWYHDQIFKKDKETGQFRINPSLFSAEGSGNADVAATINRLLNIVKYALTEYQQGVPAATPAVPESERTPAQ